MFTLKKIFILQLKKSLINANNLPMWFGKWGCFAIHSLRAIISRFLISGSGGNSSSILRCCSTVGGSSVILNFCYMHLSAITKEFDQIFLSHKLSHFFLKWIEILTISAILFYLFISDKVKIFVNSYIGKHTFAAIIIAVTVIKYPSSCVITHKY